MEEVSSASTDVHRSYPNPSIVKLFIRENCSAHQVHMLRIWSAKEAIFPLKIEENSRQREAKNCTDMDQDREMLRVYNLRLRTSGSGEIFSDLLNKIFCLQYTYLFSEHF